MENLSVKVETITPELAREYLKANTFNRELNEKTVNSYVRQIKEGQWKLNGETIAFSRGGGTSKRAA